MIVRLCQIGYRLETDNPQISLPAEPRMDTQMPSRLDRLLHPRSVAIVGISPEPGHPGSTVLANLERCRFEGAIHLVSRSRTEFNGRPCVPGIDALPYGVDVAVLVVPQAVVIDAITALGQRGVGAAIVFAAGYAEVGDVGRIEQEKLTAAANAANVAVLGPNCIGMCSFDVGAALTFEFNVERPPEGAKPKIGMVAQSGAMAAIMRMAFLAKGLGITFYISTGNEADLSVEDFLDALVDDEETASRRCLSSRSASHKNSSQRHSAPAPLASRSSCCWPDAASAPAPPRPHTPGRSPATMRPQRHFSATPQSMWSRPSMS